MSAALAQLTAQATQTLSLLLERERAQTLGGAAARAPHGAQIARNLGAIRTGVLALEARDGRSPASAILRAQHARMRGMLGPAGESIEPFPEDPAPQEDDNDEDEDGDGDDDPFADDEDDARASRAGGVPAKARARLGMDMHDAGSFAPYVDDPERGPAPSTQAMLHAQQQVMQEQDVHLDSLAQSIGRQHHISLQINDELGTQSGMLDSLDTDLDNTHTNLSRARGRLGRFAKGVKGNGGTITIALLIVILLFLIVGFKT